MTVRSYAARLTILGSPSWPKPETCTMTILGLSSHSTSSVMPLRAHVPPFEASMKMSASFTRSKKTFLPSSEK